MLLGHKSLPYISIPILVVNSADVPVAADAVPTVAIYRTDPASGTLALDLNVGTLGQIPVAALSGATGVYTATLNTTTCLFDQYLAVASYAVGGVARKQTFPVVFLPPFDVIMRDSVTPLASTGLGLKATGT